MHKEPPVTLELAKELGLNEEEYSNILILLGRIPTYTELGIFSVMWSEHCSYKNSIAILKTLPREGGRLLIAAGEENAGLVDIGDGLAIAFKIESHNHPSAVEPYQGAATGVGGILRDIFTMGARPIAALNSLRFGELSNPRSRYLFKNSVKGIGDYGNSFGVPTVAGEVYFDNCYQSNCLINAMAVGIVEHGNTAKATAGKPGGKVLIIGSSTGRDGIHGATFASEEISEKSESKRPSVQVGDPFTEKLLLEATLEAIKEGLIIGIQDMGAAGLTCSSTEMSAKAKVGMKLNLDLVPLRDSSMTSYEIMLSESQERMLIVAEGKNIQRLKQIFNKWDLECNEIGEVIESNNVKVFHKGKLRADVPASNLVLGDGAPVYYRESHQPAYIDQIRNINPNEIPEPKDLNDIFYKLIQRSNIASKRWIYHQYDSMVQTNSLNNIRNNAAIIRIKATNKAISVKTDCNSKYVYLNPYRGAQIAVAESARNVVCTGAKPIAITNCLNFGNPYDPEIFWQFKEAVKGIGDACRVLETPVTGGNVSFYNEGPEGPIYPTPVIGMLGLIEEASKTITSEFKNENEAILLLGKNRGEIGGSEYQSMASGKIFGDAPIIDIDYEKRLHQLMLSLINESLLNSANDISEGGVSISLAESCFGYNKTFGANIFYDNQNLRPDFLLFGESQSQILISCKQSYIRRIMDLSNIYKIDSMIIGNVIVHPILKFNDYLEIDLEKARDRYDSSINWTMGN